MFLGKEWCLLVLLFVVSRVQMTHCEGRKWAVPCYWSLQSGYGTEQTHSLSFTMICTFLLFIELNVLIKDLCSSWKGVGCHLSINNPWKLALLLVVIVPMVLGICYIKMQSPWNNMDKSACNLQNTIYNVVLITVELKFVS